MFKKAEHIAALITAGVFNEADKATLDKWTDDQLQVIKIPKALPIEKTLADQIPVKNAETPAPTPTPVKWRDLVPASELAMLDEMGKVFNAQLKSAIDTIKANPGNKFTDAELAEFKPAQILNMAAMVQTTVKNEEAPSPLHGMFWGGASGMPQQNVNNAGNEPKPPTAGEGLGVVSMWGDKAAA